MKAHVYIILFADLSTFIHQLKFQGIPVMYHLIFRGRTVHFN